MKRMIGLGIGIIAYSMAYALPFVTISNLTGRNLTIEYCYENQAASSYICTAPHSVTLSKEKSMRIPGIEGHEVGVLSARAANERPYFFRACRSNFANNINQLTLTTAVGDIICKATPADNP